MLSKKIVSWWKYNEVTSTGTYDYLDMFGAWDLHKLKLIFVEKNFETREILPKYITNLECIYKMFDLNSKQLSP